MTRPRAACVTCSLLDDRERIAIRLLDPDFQIGLAVRVEPLAASDGCGGPQRTQNSYDSFLLRYSSSGRIIRIPASKLRTRVRSPPPLPNYFIPLGLKFDL